MSKLVRFMLADLRGSLSLRSLWVFCTCLFLGIALVSLCSSMLHLVRGGIAEQERLLFGGDAELSYRQAITAEERNWLEQQATVSLLIELRTMLGTVDGAFTVVELQSVDDQYPLYGQISFSDVQTVSDAVRQSAQGQWGVAIDPVLQQQLNLEVGDSVLVGDLEMQVRTLISSQPDRSLRADVRGPPVLIAQQALEQSGLLQPTSLVDYEYRIRVEGDVEQWRDRLIARFPDADWEIRTLQERGEFVTERLNQVASVLLLIGCSTVLIGGLGVANSIGAYLQTKYRSIATLQALGARRAQVSIIYIGQVVVLGLLASIAGVLAGTMIAWAGAFVLAEQLPVSTQYLSLLKPAFMSLLFGLICALTFSLPALGRTIELPPAILIRGTAGQRLGLPLWYRLAVALFTVLLIGLILLIVPDRLIGPAFVLSIGLLLLALEGLVRLVSSLARKLAARQVFEGRYTWHMAVAALHRPGTPLRPMLVSLGTALTLMVACALVIAATINTLNSTVPGKTPALVFYDIQDQQLEGFTNELRQLQGYQGHATTPLVLGRLRAVNGEELSQSADARRALEANDEHKLSYRSPGIDNTALDRGEWWPADYSGPPLFAMEDREADQLGLQIGDQLRFDIMGQSVEAELAAIYQQARMQTRFWLEGVFSDGVLDPFVTRHIGSAFLEKGADVPALSTLGAAFPNVVSVRTEKALQTARQTLANAAKALFLIAVVSLLASILVMASVVAVNRSRQIYEASVMVAVGSRMSDVVKGVTLEYVLLGACLILFSTVFGCLLGWAIVSLWIGLDAGGVWPIGLAVSAISGVLCLGAGALWMLRSLQASPASLLKRSSMA